MKLLIQNYTSTLSTEPLYLNECFKRTNVINSNLWDTNKSSTFDTLDAFTPNVLMCHYTAPTLNDIIKYLAKNKNIELVLNITGAQDGHVGILEGVIEKNSISCPFFISNLHEKIHVPKTKRKLLNLLPSVDLFLPKMSLPDFNIDTAILSNSKELIEKSSIGLNTYHKIGIGVQDSYVDFGINAFNMTSLYDKYNNIILSADLSVVFSQFFFDAVFKSKKVILKTKDQKKCNEILSNLFTKDDDQEDEEKSIEHIIKNQIKMKHNCFNRAERLARAFKLENAAKILNVLGSKI